MSSPVPVRPRPRRTARGVVLALMAAALLATAPTAVASDPVVHPGLVPETPRTGFPRVSDQPPVERPNGASAPREVMAADQVGPYVVAGGNFLGVDLPDGTRLEQPYFTAWRLDTKQLVCAGLRFDNEVLAVTPGPGTTVLVAGRFSRVTDRTGTLDRSRVAKVDLASCTVDRTFVPPVSFNKIDELVLLGDRLFLGGDFDRIGGRDISTVAELDATTGRLDRDFDLDFAGGLTSRVRGMDANPAGTRLLLAGRFGTVTGSGLSVTDPTAMIDVTGTAPRLTAHSSTGYTDVYGRALPIKHLQDASFSPDGSVVGLAYGAATSSDYVYLTPMTEAAGTRYRWRHYMRDSSFGIGVSNNAVYVGGHFCKPDAGPGASEVMAPVPGTPTSCTGSTMAGGVWRSKLAALSPTDGTPLTWNPGVNAFRGAQEITVTSRGLLVGFDGYRTAGIRTGALGFFDLGA